MMAMASSILQAVRKNLRFIPLCQVPYLLSLGDDTDAADPPPSPPSNANATSAVAPLLALPVTVEAPAHPRICIAYYRPSVDGYSLTTTEYALADLVFALLAGGEIL